MLYGWSFNALIKALGNVAFKNTGMKSGDVASGDDTRILRALQKDKALSDVSSRYESITNIGGFPFKGNLKSGENLNDLTGKSYGVHVCETSGVADIGMNYPEKSAGTLVVYSTGNNDCVQLYHLFGRSSFYKRINYSGGGGWSKWELFTSNSDNLASLVNKDVARDNISCWRLQNGLGSSHLDSYKGNSYGVYYQNMSANASQGNGYPKGVGTGTLLVLQNHANGTDGCTQVYIDWYNPRQFWIRNFLKSQSRWSTWESPMFSSRDLQDLEDIEKARVNLGLYSSIYPIGVVIMFDSNTNPNKEFKNTTWSEIKDGRILRASKDGHTGTVGSDSFTLTEENIPRHSHSISMTIGYSSDHTHWGGWNAPGNTPWDERKPNESEYDAYMRLTGRWTDSSGTDNQGRHNRRYTSKDGKHTHPFSISLSYAYDGPTTPVTFYMSCRHYKLWKRIA